MKNNIIFVPTVPHSGTWTMLGLLLKHPFIKHVVELEFMIANICASRQGRSQDRNTHSFSFSDYRGGCSYDPKSVNLLTMHPSIDGNFSKFLSYALSTVVPLRDPAASFFSSLQRGSKAYTSIITSLNILIEAEKNCFFFPIDQGETSRHESLSSMCSYLGIEPSQDMHDYVSVWGKTNSRGGLSEIYARGGGLDLISKHAKTFQELLQEKDRILPFLERHGYRNLPWWR